MKKLTFLFAVFIFTIISLDIFGSKQVYAGYCIPAGNCTAQVQVGQPGDPGYSLSCATNGAIGQAGQCSGPDSNNVCYAVACPGNCGATSCTYNAGTSCLGECDSEYSIPQCQWGYAVGTCAGTNICCNKPTSGNGGQYNTTVTVTVNVIDDETGSNVPVPNAAVTLYDTNMNILATHTSDTTGSYVFNINASFNNPMACNISFTSPMPGYISISVPAGYILWPGTGQTHGTYRQCGNQNYGECTSNILATSGSYHEYSYVTVGHCGILSCTNDTLISTSTPTGVGSGDGCNISTYSSTEVYDLHKVPAGICPVAPTQISYSISGNVKDDSKNPLVNYLFQSTDTNPNITLYSPASGNTYPAVLNSSDPSQYSFTNVAAGTYTISYNNLPNSLYYYSNNRNSWTVTVPCTNANLPGGSDAVCN